MQKIHVTRKFFKAGALFRTKKRFRYAQLLIGSLCTEMSGLYDFIAFSLVRGSRTNQHIDRQTGDHLRAACPA